ncbi:Multiple sugar ABC transporter, membrane-spanning permease protein MsmF [Streptomyces formicae]|uniref:Multiple sugar ABC transporter, membrane-spanning permease protein MsmF n=1 Tax=Streptomyces formicae TaxID=1616117 RepID=A0A291QHX3_9ACTN|nr:Multiple sugar ABC transporter, membrane-spanning permease protein MsmF [Streptomyces formicae]
MNGLLFALAIVLPPRFTPERVRYDRRYRTLDKYRFIVGFLAVPLAFYALFVISPFLQAIYYSFTDWSGGPVANFVGFDNYQKMWNDDRFWDSLRVSTLLLVIAPVLTLVLGMFFAYMITSGGRHRRGRAIAGVAGSSLYKVVYFFPQVLSVAIIAVVWGRVFNTNSGLINGGLDKIGVDGPAWLGGDETLGLISLLIVISWSFVGFYVVLFSAAMGSVPQDIYEAALLDGAGRARTFFSVTLPLIWDAVRTGWIYMGIQALDTFAICLVMVPPHVLKVTPVFLYERFRDGQYGYATSIGVVLLVLSMVFSLIVMRVGNRDRIEY